MQSKSFLSTFLGNLNTILTKIKANSKEHKAPKWKDKLRISHLGKLSLSTLWPENNDNFLWTLLGWRSLSFPKIIFFFFFKFISFERDRDSVSGGGAERGKEDPKQALSCQCRVWHEARTHKTVRSWPKLKPGVGHLTDWATQVPPKMISYKQKLYIVSNFVNHFMEMNYVLTGKKKISTLFMERCHMKIVLNF